MTMLKELLAELIGMFVGDARLTLGILVLVGAVAMLIGFARIDPLIGGAVLLLGCAMLLIENVRRSSR